MTYLLHTIMLQAFSIFCFATVVAVTIMCLVDLVRDIRGDRHER